MRRMAGRMQAWGAVSAICGQPDRLELEVAVACPPAGELSVSETDVQQDAER